LIRDLEHARQALAGKRSAKPSKLWSIAAAAAVLAILIGAGFYFLRARQAAQSPAAVSTSAPSGAPENVGDLQTRYEAARRLLIEGKYDAATTAFTRLAKEAGDRQPLLNWIRLHAGLAALLQGKTSAAREMFQQIEQAGPFSTAKGDAELAAFFVETARKLARAEPVPADALANMDVNSVQSFAVFLFGAKDWQLGEFDQTAALFERFLGSEPPAAFAWIADHKQLARDFLDDYRIYAEWKKEAPQQFANSGELRAAIEKARATENKLQMGGPLSDALKNEIKRLSSDLAQRDKAEKETYERERKRLVAQEGPLWEAAMANAQREISACNYREALAAINGVSLTEASLKEAQTAERRKLEWLTNWKATLISDLNTGRFQTPVTDLPNVQYEGVAGASETAITLRIPGGRGAAPVKWTQLTPKTLLAMSSAFFNAPPPDTADRQWLAAVFAAASGQDEAAHALADSAAKAKPEYREHLPLLGSK
ncbi:MAG: hypothetical protein ABR589_12710, partial [Chthoniobacterales bacterium]